MAKIHVIFDMNVCVLTLKDNGFDYLSTDDRMKGNDNKKWFKVFLE